MPRPHGSGKGERTHACDAPLAHATRGLAPSPCMPNVTPNRRHAHPGPTVSPLPTHRHPIGHPHTRRLPWEGDGHPGARDGARAGDDLQRVWGSGGRVCAATARLHAFSSSRSGSGGRNRRIGSSPSSSSGWGQQDWGRPAAGRCRGGGCRGGGGGVGGAQAAVGEVWDAPHVSVRGLRVGGGGRASWLCCMTARSRKSTESATTNSAAAWAPHQHPQWPKHPTQHNANQRNATARGSCWSTTPASGWWCTPPT